MPAPEAASVDAKDTRTKNLIDVVGGQVGAHWMIFRGALTEIHQGLLPEAGHENEVVVSAGRCIRRCRRSRGHVDVQCAEAGIAGVGMAVISHHGKIVRGSGGSRHESGLRQLRCAQGNDRLRCNDGSIHREMAAVRGSLIEEIGQHVIVGVGDAEQAGGRIVCPALADTFADGTVTTGAWLTAGVAIVELANTPSAN